MVKIITIILLFTIIFAGCTNYVQSQTKLQYRCYNLEPDTEYVFYEARFNDVESSSSSINEQKVPEVDYLAKIDSEKIRNESSGFDCDPVIQWPNSNFCDDLSLSDPYVFDCIKVSKPFFTVVQVTGNCTSSQNPEETCWKETNAYKQGYKMR